MAPPSVTVRDYQGVGRTPVQPLGILTGPGGHGILEEDITEGQEGEDDVPQGSQPPPQFAEQFSKSPYFGRQRTRTRASRLLRSPLLTEGPSSLGFYDGQEEDLYRGASTHPRPKKEGKEDENESALDDESIASEASTMSGLDLGRRFTRAVGDALGVRRGSHGSTASDSSSDSSSDDTDNMAEKRNRMRSKRSRPRGLSFGTQRSNSPDSTARSAGTRREIIPVYREFSLLLPTGSISRVPPPPPPHVGTGPDTTSEVASAFAPSRIVTTPSLPLICQHIRDARVRSGYLPPTSALPTPVHEVDDPLLRRPTSEPGHRRTASSERRPGLAKTHRSRTETLRAESSEGLRKRPSSHADLTSLSETESSDGLIRPRSASDLLGLGPSSKPPVKRPRPFALPSKPILPRGLSLGISPRSSSSPGRDSPSPAVSLLKEKEPQECWWLDVSCPVWEDLRDLGELLQLHPLTLEDVLQQDPREKIDVFEKLGYYFIVFRAIDETYFKYTEPEVSDAPKKRKFGIPTVPSRVWFHDLKRNMGRTRSQREEARLEEKDRKSRGKVEIIEDRPGKEGLEGITAGGLNVYLVVFADGIVSFHFGDISKHTTRVRDRILSMEQDTKSADWIAHGLMDSIVDAFFPLVGYLDGEVDEIDSLTIDPSTNPRAKLTAAQQYLDSQVKRGLDGNENIELSDLRKEKSNTNPSTDSTDSSWVPSLKGHGSASLSTLVSSNATVKRLIAAWQVAYITVWWALKSFQSSLVNSKIGLPAIRASRRFGRSLGIYGNKRQRHSADVKPVYDRTHMLRRMTEIRKLVTGLTRLLGFKHQVINRLKKRAAEGGGEVSVYIGDVQDHIAMLETSLLHQDYVLSHCQSAYVTHLGVSFSIARGKADSAILALSTVSIGVLPLQVIIGLFSMNIRIPANGDPTHRSDHSETDGSMSPFNLFYIVLGMITLAAFGVLWLVQYWKDQAKIKWGGLNAIRAEQEQMLAPPVINVPPTPQRRRRLRRWFKWRKND